MKIVLTTFGSRGDVQPMLALSCALQSAGHEILLAGPPEKAGWAEHLGCPFYPLGSNLTAFIDSMKDAHSLRAGFSFVQYFRKEVIAQCEVLPEIIAGSDLVVGASLVVALSTLAERMGIPYRYIAFTPQILPSGDHPFPAFKTQGLPRWYNRMTWQIIKMVDQLNLTLLINKKRTQLGLSTIKDVWLHILGKDVIVASDKAIAQVPSDVTPAFVQTGYMHLNQPDRYNQKLEEFLDKGPPPVYAGFGSMPKRDQARNVSLIVEAARGAGQRVVIAKFWDEPAEFFQADDIFFIKHYPHLKLFPRMAAVIHHGGAGTTASCAISGVPQIVVPHVLDQYYWAHRVYSKGLGPKPIRRSQLTPQRLRVAIQESVTKDRIKRNAKEVSELIKRDNGVEMTLREIVKVI